MDVAIVGVGLHPFGRFAGVSAIQMGAIAVRNALADAGVAWRDIQFAFAGSYEVDNPDAVVALLGLTGIPFNNVYNGCATAASALTLAANTIRLGEYELGIAVGMDKHLPGAFSADPRLYACPSWYGELEIGGRLPVNTDGGLLANGEPIGASGLRQVHEIVLQLRGDAGERQVPGTPSVGFTQVYGAPGVSCCTLLTT